MAHIKHTHSGDKHTHSGEVKQMQPTVEKNQTNVTNALLNPLRGI